MAVNFGMADTMASGLKEGLLAYQTTQNIKRNNQLQNLLQGVQDDGNGNLSLSAEGQQKRDLEMGLLKAQAAKAMAPDENLKITAAKEGLMKNENGDYVKTPEQIARDKAKQGVDEAHAAFWRNGGTYSQGGARETSQNERVHKWALSDLNNQDLRTLTNTYMNLSNAEKNFKEGGATPQEFSELQQAVRSNLGIKGAGGVGEREETYLKSLGLNAAKFNQFITGDPKSVLDADPAFAQQVLGLVEIEKKNKREQFQGMLEAAKAGHNSFYEDPKHEKYKTDRDAVIAQKSKMMGIGDQAPSGLINKTGPDPDAVKYSQMHNIPIDQAAQIIAKRKAQMGGG